MADTYTKVDDDTLAVTTEVEKQDLEQQLAAKERRLAKTQAQIVVLRAKLKLFK